MKTVDYQCPMCGKSCHAKYYDDVRFNMEQWIPLAHCNDCADLKQSLDLLLKHIREAAVAYRNEKWRRRGHQAIEVTSAARKAVSKDTKSLVQIVCSYYNVVCIWEPNFVEKCLNYPDKLNEILYEYIRMVKDKSKNCPQTILSSDHHRTADSK